MMKLTLITLILFGSLSISACTPTCPSELTPSQCANEGTHEYIRTYDFVEGCGKSPGLIEGNSEFTWTFSPQGDTLTFAALFPDNPPVPESLITIRPDVYRPVQEESLQSQIQLTEAGFNWLYFDPGTNDLCYQVIFTLSE